MQIIRTKQALREWISAEREGGQTIAVTPTMGALHAGHLSLVEIGKHYCSRTIATIFVNPKQFGPNEDFDTYPRTEAADLELLKKAGVDAVYIPTTADMYPDGFATQVAVQGISDELEGKFRPGFFHGVATVVTKLLLQCLADVAVFGEKDYQQLHIIRKMAADLDIPTAIMGAPIIRESDGLAMSSRNRYLSASDRATAPKLYAVLQDTAQKIQKNMLVKTALEAGITAITQAGFKLDYLELRDAKTLAPLPVLTVPGRLLVAAKLGDTRLIDNVAV